MGVQTTAANKHVTCLARDTVGKRTRRAQRTSFNTLDNWGHKTPTQSKKKRTTARNTHNTLGTHTLTSNTNRGSSEIQGTALGKSLRAWTCIYRSMPAGVASPKLPHLHRPDVRPCSCTTCLKRTLRGWTSVPCLLFCQNGQDLLRKSQNRKLTLEKNILPPLLAETRTRSFSRSPAIIRWKLHC